MFQKLIILSIFSLSISCWGRAPGSYSQAKSELQKVTQRNLIDMVNSLIKESAPSRMVGLPGHEKAIGYIRDTIMKADPKGKGQIIFSSSPADVDAIKAFYQKDFDTKVQGKIPASNPDYSKWLNFTRNMQSLADAKKSVPVRNITWEKTGIKADKVLVITAHYDTISHDKNTLLVKVNEPMPGANYNASGVAVALGLIKVLTEIDLNYSVRVVFLDWQGIGFHGSQVYAKELKNAGDVIGVINLEMLGQDSSYLDKKKKTGNMSVYLRDDANEMRFVKKLVEHGSKITQKVSFEIKPNGFESSDNFRFWEQGFQAVTFSQNWEDDFNPKFYQTALDTSETLNHETLWHAYQYVGGGVLGTLLDLTK